jgi:hypothetical protein
MAEKINLAPFNLVEREHKDTASRLLQSLVVSVKLSGGVYTPNFSLKQAVEAARKCYDVRLAVVGDDIDIPKIYHLTEIIRPVGGGYAIRFVCGNDSIVWSASGMAVAGTITDNWPDNFQWLYDVEPRTLDNILYRICAVLNTVLQQVNGKMVAGSFFAVQDESNGEYTFKSTAETPSAKTLYYDVENNKLYKFDTATSSFVEFGIRDFNDITLPIEP